MTKITNGQAAPFNAPAKRQSLNLKYFNALVFAAIAGLGVFYLILINDLTVEGFALQKLSSQMANLASTNMSCQEQVNVAQAYPSLNAHIQGLHLVAVGNVEYLPVNDLTVAKK